LLRPIENPGGTEEALTRNVDLARATAEKYGIGYKGVDIELGGPSARAYGETEVDASVYLYDPYLRQRRAVSPDALPRTTARHAGTDLRLYATVANPMSEPAAPRPAPDTTTTNG
jgi:hypothetical protein